MYDDSCNKKALHCIAGFATPFFFSSYLHSTVRTCDTPPPKLSFIDFLTSFSVKTHRIVVKLGRQKEEKDKRKKKLAY